MSERTLIIIKPDGVQRRLVGEIIGRFEKKGMKIVGAKFFKIGRELAERHYSVHIGKVFFERAVNYLCDSPVLLMILQGEGVIDSARKMMGETFGFESQPGTIRADFSLSRVYNILHGSDSAESAVREIELYFRPEEIFDYKIVEEKWVS